ncbi:MAG: signal peptidase I [Clostridia bacterium]
MQKSKSATIAFIIGILFYGLLATFLLSKKVNILYLYVINPIFWILLVCILRYLLGKNTENHKLRKQIVQYTIVATLVFIITYMLSGLFVTFGKNPYSTTLIGLFHNLWIFGSVLIAKEYVRYKLINNVYDKDKVKIAIFISIVYVIIDLELSYFIGKSVTTILIVKYVMQTVIPMIIRNILFSYTSIYSDWIPGAIYQILTNLYYWISPILPKAPWVMTAIIDTVIPAVLLLYIRFTKNKLDIFRTKENIRNSDPKNIIPLLVVIVLAIWFATGVFPIKPIAIASGSMEKELFVGDIAIIQKCNANDVNVGDIIEYQMDGYTVIHRIIEKKQKKGEYYFITKGDNNKYPDSKEVRENQLIGKVIFKIRYLGYPAIWLHIIQENEQTIQIETGN